MDTIAMFFNLAYSRVKNAWENPFTIDPEHFDATCVDAFLKMTRGEQNEILREAMGKHLTYRKSNLKAATARKITKDLLHDPDVVKMLKAKGILPS